MSRTPKVSVLVPVMNVEKYLGEALESLRRQTLRDIEFLVLDDGSTDGSLRIMKEFAAADRRFKIIEKENTGYGHTMNVGIDWAKGEYIGILEPDDFVSPVMFERLYKEAKEYELDFVKSDFIQFRQETNRAMREGPVRLAPDDSWYHRTLTPGKEKACFFFPINTWTGIYRREFLNAHHIRHHESPGASFQDNGFYFQTFCLGEKVRFLPERLYHYRVDNPDSSSLSQGKERCVTDEFHWIHDWLARDPALLAEYESILYDKQYYSMTLTLDRLPTERKLPYLRHMREELAEPFRQGKMDRNYLQPEDWETLEQILEDPEKVCEGLMKKEAADRAYEKTTGLSRRIQSGVRLLKKQGAAGVVRYIAEKIRG